MIEWTYAQVPTKCGGCFNVVAIGDPLRLTHITGVKRALPRCTECAGPPPADLPPFVLAGPPPPVDPPPARRGQPTDADTWMPYRDE